jgi:hypothetical protein
MADPVSDGVQESERVGLVERALTDLYPFYNIAFDTYCDVPLGSLWHTQPSFCSRGWLKLHGEKSENGWRTPDSER